jgi:hypothetical protein
MGILNEIVERKKQQNPNLNLYKTKLNIIENSIYGVDIQPIAIQISKLRFFISLIVEQTPNANQMKAFVDLSEVGTQYFGRILI